MRISQAREDYVRWLLATRDLSPHTIRAYEGDVAALERHLGGEFFVADIGTEGVMAFVEEQRAAGLSSASIRRRVAGVRGFGNWLVDRGLTSNRDWTRTTVPTSRKRSLPRVVSHHDLQRLFTVLQREASNGDQPPGEIASRPNEVTTLLATALMITTGMRVNEVVGVELSDIDLQGRSMRLMGKGRRERQVFLANDWITRLTERYLSMRHELDVAHPYLLFNRHKRPLTSAALRSRLAKAGEHAGIRRRLTPHMLRHTAATQLIESGVDIRYIQRLLGHASLSTTEIYTHVSNQALQRVVSEADILRRWIGGDN